jgi:hypothetical protein
VDYIALMKIVYCLKNLPDSFGGILFSKLSLFANSVKQLAACSEFRDDIPFILNTVSPIQVHSGDNSTFDSNHS